MKKLVISSLAGVGLLMFSFAATAQDRDRDDPDAYHHDRDSYFRGQGWHARLFERVRDDVRHVQEVTWPRGGDQYRLGRTEQELSELQGKLANRDYDEHELDEVIGALSHVVSDNHMRPRDRDLLNDDLARLREFREHHEEWYRR